MKAREGKRVHDRRRYREKDPERSVPRFCVKPTLPIEFFIAEMVEYDYTLLGAPWIDSTRWCMQHGRCSGNSGLSLWNVRTMEALARRSVEWRSNQFQTDRDQLGDRRPRARAHRAEWRPTAPNRARGEVQHGADASACVVLALRVPLTEVLPRGDALRLPLE